MTTRVEIGERLRAERQRVELTQGELAQVAGVSKTSQVNYEAGSRSPDAEYLSAIAGSGIDVLFVLTGSRGIEGASSDDFVVIPGLADSVVDGVQNHSTDQSGQAFSRKWIETRGLIVGNLRVIQVRGASMDKVLSDGDLVLVDRSDTMPRSGFVYVIRQGDELLVKYCQLMPAGLLRVSSANSDFVAYDVDLSKTPDVSIVGRVVASMHEW